MRYLYCSSRYYLTLRAEKEFISIKHACKKFQFLNIPGIFLEGSQGSVYLACLWAGSMVTRLITTLLSTCTGPRQPIRRLGAASEACDWLRGQLRLRARPAPSHQGLQLSQPLSADPDKKIYPGQNIERQPEKNTCPPAVLRKNRLLPGTSSKCSMRGFSSFCLFGGVLMISLVLSQIGRVIVTQICAVQSRVSNIKVKCHCCMYVKTEIFQQLVKV